MKALFFINFAPDNPSYDLSKPVFVDYTDSTQYVSGLQLRSLAKRLANGLRLRAKVSEGDVVFLSSTNTVCQRVNIVPVPLPHTYLDILSRILSRGCMRWRYFHWGQHCLR